MHDTIYIVGIFLSNQDNSIIVLYRHYTVII